jgi:PAB-dependent poly(A)-specific ribonuclease subunit 2
VLIYTRTDLNNIIPSLEFDNPILKDTFFYEIPSNKLKQLTFKPLPPSELPGKGDIVAIDAEFISLSHVSLQNLLTIKNSILSLGRVSVIRDGDDVPFIDDYIATNEDVQDYLTRFSGLKIGDLDPSSTSHFVTTLKVMNR